MLLVRIFLSESFASLLEPVSDVAYRRIDVDVDIDVMCLLGIPNAAAGVTSESIPATHMKRTIR